MVVMEAISVSLSPSSLGLCRNRGICENVILNPESVILNLVQNLFRAGLFQHLVPNRHETLKRVQGDKKNYDTVSRWCGRVEVELNPFGERLGISG